MTPVPPLVRSANPGLPLLASNIDLVSTAKTSSHRYSQVTSHREGVARSDRALELLRSATSSSYPPGHSKGPLKFNLEVITSLPTKDQLRTIESYLPHGGLASFVTGGSPATTDQVLSQAKRDVDAFKWPVVVDWVGGKASVGDIDGVNEILENLRKKRDGETNEPEEHKPKGWFS